jgi:predicted Rossmann fold nucleotide-binding protein DprA/Smf involved in DNA uptake
MDITPQTQAVLLLTAYFSKPAEGSPRPLSPTEWGRFALWLKERGVSPEALLGEDPGLLLTGWEDRTVSADRIRYLIGRAGALGLALEKWQRAGIWVVTRSDIEYPARLKKRLKTDSPPLLFGCGNRKLLGGGGIAVVGSRNATEEDLAFASRLGGMAAAQGLSVVSGGARGIDEAAMLGALEREGTVIGVLAEGLLRAVTSAKYRKGLMARNLVLVSPFNPEAGFDIGNAMARNKYIYCVSDAAIVVTSTSDKGGTWNGAIENIKQNWVPLWIKQNSDAGSGNAELVRKGACWLPEGEFDLTALFAAPDSAQSSLPLASLLDDAGNSSATTRNSRASSSLSPILPEVAVASPREMPATDVEQTPVCPEDANESLSFYHLFLNRLKALTGKTPATTDELLGRMDIGKTQLEQWLKRAVKEGRAKRLRKPARYQWQMPQPKQGSMFGKE